MLHPAIRRQTGSWASGAFLTEARNAVLGPSGPGDTQLATGLVRRHRADAHRHGRPQTELATLLRHGLIVVGGVGYLPIEQDAAKLFFQLVSSRYEHAALILTSNLPLSSRVGVFGAQSSASSTSPSRHVRSGGD